MTDALLTIAVMPNGELHAIPGRDFTPEHMSLLTEITGAVNDTLEERR
jgi:hypothetical protein